jgi:hypothetical protein
MRLESVGMCFSVAVANRVYIKKQNDHCEAFKEPRAIFTDFIQACTPVAKLTYCCYTSYSHFSIRLLLSLPRCKSISL